MIASQYVDYDDKKICAYLLNLRHLRAIFTYLFLLLSYTYSHRQPVIRYILSHY